MMWIVCGKNVKGKISNKGNYLHKCVGIGYTYNAVYLVRATIFHVLFLKFENEIFKAVLPKIVKPSQCFLEYLFIHEAAWKELSLSMQK